MGRLIERGARPRNMSTVDPASTSRLMRGLLDPVGVDTETRSTAMLSAQLAKRANISLKLDDVLARAHEAAADWAALRERVAAGESVDATEVERVSGALLDVLAELGEVVEDNQK